MDWASLVETSMNTFLIRHCTLDLSLFCWTDTQWCAKIKKHSTFCVLAPNPSLSHLWYEIVCDEFEHPTRHTWNVRLHETFVGLIVRHNYRDTWAKPHAHLGWSERFATNFRRISSIFLGVVGRIQQKCRLCLQLLSGIRDSICGNFPQFYLYLLWKTVRWSLSKCPYLTRGWAWTRVINKQWGPTALRGCSPKVEVRSLLFSSLRRAIIIIIINHHKVYWLVWESIVFKQKPFTRLHILPSAHILVHVNCTRVNQKPEEKKGKRRKEKRSEDDIVSVTQKPKSVSIFWFSHVHTWTIYPL